MKIKVFKVAMSLMCMLISLSAVANTKIADSLQESLKEQGWQASKTEDGSVIYRRDNYVDEVGSKKTPLKEGKKQLVKVLQNKGWDANWKDDGSLVLHPKVKKALSNDGKVVDKFAIPDLSDHEYWRVSRTADGSMVFKPVDKATIPVKETSSSDLVGCEENTAEVSSIDLPVDQRKEVHELAQSWLDKSGVTGLMVGTSRPIRRYEWFYLVNLVSDYPPYTIRYQIAIRASDGSVIRLR